MSFAAAALLNKYKPGSVMSKPGLHQRFVEVCHALNKGDLWCSDTRLLIVKAEKVTKPSLKYLAVRQIQYKLRKFNTSATLPRSGHLTEITQKNIAGCLMFTKGHMDEPDGTKQFSNQEVQYLLKAIF